MEVMSRNRRVNISPQKVRLVADMVRGQEVAEALAMLKFTPQRGAEEISRTIKAAQADAEQVHDLDPDGLFIKSIWIDEGPTFKRWRARARGRVNRRLKRTCHISVVLDEVEE